MIGGHDGLAELDTVEMYDTRSGSEWRMCPTMHRRRFKMAVAALNTTIYVCGGREDSTHHDSIEALCTVNEQWSLLSTTAMSCGRSWLACAVLTLDNPLVKHERRGVKHDER